MRDTGFLRRMSGFVPLVGNEPRLLEKAFTMKPGEMTDTLQVATGVVWMRLEEKKSGDAATFKTATASIEGEMAKAKYDQWLEARKKAMRIEILRPDLKAPRPPTAPTATLSSGG